jgi:hypothetical protein
MRCIGRGTAMLPASPLISVFYGRHGALAEITRELS